jgi:hypothetical protein
MTKTLLAGLQLLLTLALGGWGWYWLPRFSSQSLAELAASGYKGDAPIWAQSFYLGRFNAVEFSRHLPPSEDPLLFVFAVVVFIVLFCALLVTFSDHVQVSFSPKRP